MEILKLFSRLKIYTYAQIQNYIQCLSLLMRIFCVSAGYQRDKNPNS